LRVRRIGVRTPRFGGGGVAVGGTAPGARPRSGRRGGPRRRRPRGRGRRARDRGSGGHRQDPVAPRRAGPPRSGSSPCSARGGELEQGTPYGLVRELFAAPLAQHGSEELLAGPAALAAPVVAGSGEIAVGGGPHGLYWLTVNLADRAPLVLAVDDVHWADEASLRFLGYLARRLDGLPVLLVLAARTGEPGGDRPTVGALLDDPLATVLRPAPLSAAAAAAVVRAAPTRPRRRRAVPRVPHRRGAPARRGGAGARPHAGCAARARDRPAHGGPAPRPSRGCRCSPTPRHR